MTSISSLVGGCNRWPKVVKIPSAEPGSACTSLTADFSVTRA